MLSFTGWAVQNDFPEFIYQERSNGNKKAIYYQLSFSTLIVFT